MNDDAAKANLYDYLKHEREAVLAKLDGLTEYDARRPLTVTGTNLLGLVKHLATWEHSDATVAALALDATGRVAWWQDAEVSLFNILVHLLAETSRHAGHADILREELDGAVGTDAEGMAVQSHGPDFWMERRKVIEAAARSAG